MTKKDEIVLYLDSRIQTLNFCFRIKPDSIEVEKSLERVKNEIDILTTIKNIIISYELEN